MKTILLLSFLVNVHAQQIAEDPARPVIGKEGQVFSIRFTPGQRLLEVRFVDTPLAKIEPGRLTVTATIKNFKMTESNISAEEKGGEIRMPAPLSTEKTYEFHIRDKVSKKSEVIHVEPKP